MNDEHQIADGHMGDPVKRGEPTVRLSGEHLVVAFCSVLETLRENSLELAQKDTHIESLENTNRELRAQNHENTLSHIKERDGLLEVADYAKKDPDRLDILHDFAKNHGRVLIICDTRGFGIADDSARMMQPPLGLNDYRQTLRSAIDAIGSDGQEGGTA